MKKVLFSFLLVFIISQFSFSQTDSLNSWSVNVTDVGRIYCGAINPLNDNTMYIAGLDSGVYKTTNAGLNWFAINNGLLYKKVQAFAVSPSNPDILYCGTDSLGGVNNGIYKSSDAGNNWTLINNGLLDHGIQAIAVHPSNPNIVWITVFNAVGPAAIGIYKTTDGGANWFAANNGIASDNKNFLAIIVNPLNPDVLYAGTSLVLPGSTGPSKIYKSFDGGLNWVLMSNGMPTATTSNNPVRALCFSQNDTSVVLAALFVNDTTGGIYLTTNSGNNWTKKYGGLPNTTGTLYRACMIKPDAPDEFYLGVDQSSATTPRGVWRSTNNGNNWTDFSGGLLLNTYSTRLLMYKQSNHTLYAGCSHSTIVAGRGLFEYTFPPTGVKHITSDIPGSYYLGQNYPNPFNPLTKIKFSVPADGFVKLKIFDVLGREITVLVNEVKNAGTYVVDFDASGLSGGVYFYKIEVNGFVDVKKMMLIK